MYYWSGLSDDTLHNIHKILLVFFSKDISDYLPSKCDLLI